MARLIPKVDVSTIENHGERIVAQALVQQLPADCIVYHSYSWLRPERNDWQGKDTLREGEADFVILFPDKGLLVLEAKGGELEIEPSTGHWFRTVTSTGQKTRLRKDPFVQASKNMHKICDTILEHPSYAGQAELPFTRGYAVVLPHCRYSGPPLAEHRRPFLIDAIGVQSIHAAISKALSAFSARLRGLDRCDMEAIQEALSPMLHFTPVLFRTIEQQEERIKRLTDEQVRILDVLQNCERAAIQGVAGSGKTIIALAQAQRFAGQGKRTLLVCYNKLLATWLLTQIPEKYAQSIVVTWFHRLCSDFCGFAGLPFDSHWVGQDFWQNTAPELLEKASGLLDTQFKFDAIVVDEGQDFFDLWWIALESLYREHKASGPLYVFFDPKQNIFVKDLTLPQDLGGPFVLAKNCRNTRAIATLCGSIMRFNMETLDDTPEGEVPEEIEVRGHDIVVQSTRKIVNDWCLRERGALAPRQVAILTTGSIDGSRGDDSKWPDSIGTVPLVRDFALWQNNKGVLLTTVRRFKGLEADALVLAGVPRPGLSEWYKVEDHYVATSRAKHLLKIVIDTSAR